MKKLADRIAAGLIANHSEYVDVNGFGMEASTINVTNLVGFSPETAAEFTRRFGKNDVLAARIFRKYLLDGGNVKDITPQDLAHEPAMERHTNGVSVFADLGTQGVSESKTKWLANSFSSYANIGALNDAYEKATGALDLSDVVVDSGNLFWIKVHKKDVEVMCARMQHCNVYGGQLYMLVDKGGRPYVSADVMHGLLTQVMGKQNSAPVNKYLPYIKTLIDTLDLKIQRESADMSMHDVIMQLAPERVVDEDYDMESIYGIYNKNLERTSLGSRLQAIKFAIDSLDRTDKSGQPDAFVDIKDVMYVVDALQNDDDSRVQNALAELTPRATGESARRYLLASTINVTNLVGFNPEAAAEFTKMFGKNDVLAARIYRKVYWNGGPVKDVSAEYISSVGYGLGGIIDDLHKPGLSSKKVKWLTDNLGAYASFEDFEDAYLEANADPIDTEDVVTQPTGGMRWVRVNGKDFDNLAKLMQHCTDFRGDIYSLMDAKNDPHVTVDVVDGVMDQIQGKQNSLPASKYIPYIKLLIDHLKLRGVDDTVVYKEIVALFPKGSWRKSEEEERVRGEAEEQERLRRRRLVDEQVSAEEEAAAAERLEAEAEESYNWLVALGAPDNAQIMEFIQSYRNTNAAYEAYKRPELEADDKLHAISRGWLDGWYLAEIAKKTDDPMTLLHISDRLGNGDNVSPASENSAIVDVAANPATPLDTLTLIAAAARRMPEWSIVGGRIRAALLANPSMAAAIMRGANTHQHSALLNVPRGWGVAGSGVASGILERHAEYLTASGWNMTELRQKQGISYDNIDVELGDTRIACQIADTDELQSLGLQKHAGLEAGEGMVFPYDPPRKVSFHMAKVSFPIDIVFINSSRKISRIVEEIEPGTPGSWGMNHVALVVEVPGGFCRENGISVGDDAGAVSDRTAAIDMEAAPKYYDASKLPPDQLAKLKSQVARAFQIQQSGALDKIPANQKEMVMWLLEMGAQPVLGGHRMSAQEKFPSYPRKDINPKMLPTNPTKDRFKDHGLPDETTENQPMDGAHYDQTQGYDPTKDMSDEVAPVRPMR